MAVLVGSDSNLVRAGSGGIGIFARVESVMCVTFSEKMSLPSVKIHVGRRYWFIAPKQAEQRSLTYSLIRGECRES
jgi:hypothetical protein